MDQRTAPGAAPGGPRHLPGVDGLRALAALAVVVHHVHLYAAPDGQRYALGPGDTVGRTIGVGGVVLFFTLSGYLLYRPFAASLLMRRPAPDVRAYLRNRALRILPAYWLALVVTGLVLRTTYASPGAPAGGSLLAEPAVLGANLLLVQGWSPQTLLTGIGPTWSLGVEVAFYLVLPVLAALSALLAVRAPLCRRPLLAACLPAVALLGLGQLGWRLAAALPPGDGGPWHGSWHAVVSRSLLAHAGVFSAGLLLAVVHVQVERRALVLPRWWRTAAACAAVPLLAGSLVLHDRGLSENRTSLAASTACALLLALVVVPGGSDRRRILSSRLLSRAGLVSYGVFLWNEPVVHLLRQQGLTTTGAAGYVLALVLTLLVSLVAAALSWRLVERPALSCKRPSPGRAPAAPVVVGLPVQPPARDAVPPQAAPPAEVRPPAPGPGAAAP